MKILNMLNFIRLGVQQMSPVGPILGSLFFDTKSSQEPIQSDCDTICVEFGKWSNLAELEEVERSAEHRFFRVQEGYDDPRTTYDRAQEPLGTF